MQALKFKTISCLSVLLCSIHIGHAAVLQDNHHKKTIPSSSPITKALNQQKHNTLMLPSTDDELKMLNTLHTTPTQNFFASQHERFSRFVQSIFPLRQS